MVFILMVLFPIQFGSPLTFSSPYPVTLKPILKLCNNLACNRRLPVVLGLFHKLFPNYPIFPVRFSFLFFTSLFGSGFSDLFPEFGVEFVGVFYWFRHQFMTTVTKLSGTLPFSSSNASMSSFDNFR